MADIKNHPVLRMVFYIVSKHVLVSAAQFAQQLQNLNI